METVHTLEPHKAQRDTLALRNLVLSQIYDLCRFGVHRVFHITETYGRSIDEKLDETWLLCHNQAFDDDGAYADGLIELESAERTIKKLHGQGTAIDCTRRNV